MADQFIDEVVSSSAPAARQHQRGPIEMVEGPNGRALPIDGQGQVVETDDVASTGGRVLPDSVKARFAEMRAAKAAGATLDTDDDEDAPPGETTKEAAEAAGNVPDPTAPPVANAPVADPAAPPVADPHAGYKSQIDRLGSANAQLVQELDAERKKPRESTELTTLREASSGYLEDSTTSLRKFIAMSIGVADPAAPEVDAELKLLYGDLTAKELGVTPDEAHQAKRDAARAKQLWAREKRERKAEELSKSDGATRTAEAQQDAEAATYIGTQLGQKAVDYPLVTNLAPLIDGCSPGDLILKVIKHEIRVGRLDPKTQSDDAMIAHAAQHAETHYRGLIAKANQAIPPNQNPSTATPSGKSPPAATTSARPDQRQSPAARTLTTADASVAPPAPPPAAKPTPKDDKPPTFKTDDERKRWALRHIRAKKSS